MKVLMPAKAAERPDGPAKFDTPHAPNIALR
jgi:hypothetical protein